MKRLLALFVILIIGILLLSACQSGTDTTAEEPVADESGGEEETMAEESMGEEVTLVVGFTSSLTGAQEVSSKRQVNGFNLWMEQVNQGGGVVFRRHRG